MSRRPTWSRLRQCRRCRSTVRRRGRRRGRRTPPPPRPERPAAACVAPTVTPLAAASPACMMHQEQAAGTNTTWIPPHHHHHPTPPPAPHPTCRALDHHKPLSITRTHSPPARYCALSSSSTFHRCTATAPPAHTSVSDTAGVHQPSLLPGCAVSALCWAWPMPSHRKPVSLPRLSFRFFAFPSLPPPCTADAALSSPPAFWPAAPTTYLCTAHAPITPRVWLAQQR